MNWLFRALGSTLAAMVATVAISIATVIWLMFSEGAAEGRRHGYFGSLFVEVNQKADGTTQLGVGILNPTALVVTMVAVTLLLLAVIALYHRLLARKRYLLAGNSQ